MKRSFVFLALAISSTMLSCGGDGTGGGGAGGTMTTSTATSAGVGTCTPALADPGTIGSADAGTACHSLTNCAAEIEFQSAGGAAPVPKGGTVADGLYALTAARVYGVAVPAGLKLRVTMLVQGTTGYSVASTQGAADGYVTGTFTTSGTQMTNAVTCPGAGTQERQFTIDGDLWLDFDIDAAAKKTVVYEYTLVK